MKHGLIVVWLLLMGCRLAAQGGAVERVMNLSVRDGELVGTLLAPAADNPVPVVLLIAGSGPTDRDGNTAVGQMKNNSLKMLAEGLAQAGIASVRYDKRGVAASKKAGGEEAALRFEHYVCDAIAWIDTLASDGRFGGIYVAGHSEGSLVGMLACQSRKDVKGFISLAGAGSPAYELIEQQVASQPEGIRRMVAEINASLRKGVLYTPVPAPLYALYRPSVQPYLISWFRYHPAVVMMTLSCPALIVQGTTDIQVPVAEAEKLQQWAPGAQLLLIEGMNHVLKPCASTEAQAQLAVYAHPTLPLSAELVPAVAGFIRSSH